jgi:NifU-like protein involved in Fe-S cluster formation
MIDDLYSARILSLAANLPHAGRLGAPEGTGERVAKLCGSRATVDVTLDDQGCVADFAQDVKACALGQAAAGVLGQHVIGASIEEIVSARDAMSAMLKSGGDGPTGRFEDLRLLKQVADYPARHASTLVSIEATLDAATAALAARTRLAGAA